MSDNEEIFEILVLDDDEVICEALESRLQETLLSPIVKICQNVSDAQNYLETTRPDLSICDATR